MDTTKLAKAAAPASMARYLRKRAGEQGHHAGHATAARETVHDGHRILLETIYRVTVDGREVDLGITVDDAGQVHCHSLPNYQFASALDMVKTLIDQFPDDFRRSRPGSTTGPAHLAGGKHAANRPAKGVAKRPAKRPAKRTAKTPRRPQRGSSR